MKKVLIVAVMLLVLLPVCMAAEMETRQFFKLDIVGWYGGWTFGFMTDQEEISLSYITNTILYSTIINIAWMNDVDYDPLTLLMPVTPGGVSFNYTVKNNHGNVEFGIPTSIGWMFTQKALFLGSGIESTLNITKNDAIYARLGLALMVQVSGLYVYMLPYYVGAGYRYSF